MKEKICLICKTPIENGIEVKTDTGFVHMGTCQRHYNELNESLNETLRDEEIKEIQLLID